MRVDTSLVNGTAEGELLRIDEPVSFWGGVSPETGRIVDADHPQRDTPLTGKILVMPHARGSSGTSSGFADLIRSGLGPVGVVLESPDMMLTGGALVARSLYGTTIPVVVADLDEDAFGRWRIEGGTLERSQS